MMSAILAFAIDKIPGLKLRASEEAELLGMDDDQLGEFAYDYVEVRRDYLAWTPVKEGVAADGGSVRTGSGEGDGIAGVKSEDRYGVLEHRGMIQGQDPEKEESGHQHTMIMGDRHGIAAEEKEKERMRERERRGADHGV